MFLFILQLCGSKEQGEHQPMLAENQTELVFSTIFECTMKVSAKVEEKSRKCEHLERSDIVKNFNFFRWKSFEKTAVGKVEGDFKGFWWVGICVAGKFVFIDHHFVHKSVKFFWIFHKSELCKPQNIPNLSWWKDTYR